MKKVPLVFLSLFCWWADVSMRSCHDPNSYLWYWACRKWNSSLIRSQDSVTVNFNGCPGWWGTSIQTKQRVGEERKNWATKVQGHDTHRHTHTHGHTDKTVDDNRPLWYGWPFGFTQTPYTLTHAHSQTHTCSCSSLTMSAIVRASAQWHGNLL